MLSGLTKSTDHPSRVALQDPYMANTSWCMLYGAAYIVYGIWSAPLEVQGSENQDSLKGVSGSF